MSTITLSVGEEEAKAYHSLSEKERSVLSEYVKRKLNHMRLLDHLQRSADYAKKNGLTEAELDAILKDVS